MMADVRDKLVKDIKTLFSDLELALDDVKGKTNQEVAELQINLKRKIADAKVQLTASEQDFLAKEKIAIEMTDNYTRDNVWKFILIAAFIGFLLGYSL
jgi:ElaB/YqjD/DUF883 family membrane-anchored ribosome-binding protein